MSEQPYGRILAGDEDTIRRSYELWSEQEIDQAMPADDGWQPDRMQTTIKEAVSVAGPGTYLGKATRTVTFVPSDESDEEGWWFDREDLSDSLPLRVSVRNVWTTVRNIVLCSGSPHNYMRMVEHIIALKIGLGIDNLLIRTDSGDPPLFDRGSLDLAEALEKAEIVTQRRPIRYFTVREPVTVGGDNGRFLTLLPCSDSERPMLSVDCAVDFNSSIGKQRITFDVTRKSGMYGAFARTNTTLGMMVYARTIGKLFADIRNLGYTHNNIVITGKTHYYNEPRMLHEGKSLEAVWHRASLDLLAAIALIGRGRLVGKVISYKAGHTLDVEMIKRLYQEKLLTPIT